MYTIIIDKILKCWPFVFKFQTHQIKEIEIVNVRPDCPTYVVLNLLIEHDLVHLVVMTLSGQAYASFFISTV